MSILDNSQGNFASWRETLFEQVSILKYGDHAVCLITSAPAPVFRPCPSVDAVTIYGTYEYQHMDAPAADPATITNTLLIGIPGRLTICGQTFFRQDTASYTAEKDKFNIQGLELFELVISKISQTSKLIAKTQPGYSRAMQTNCPHELMATLAASHQTSSATRSLSALANFLSIRQNGQSHPNLVDKINTAFDHVVTCWESPIHAGYIATEDLRAAAYLNALDASLYAAPKERFLAANPDLRGTNALQLQQTIQTYSVALDLDNQEPPTVLYASDEVPYCLLCFERTKKLGNPRKFTNHGVPGKEACKNGIKTQQTTKTKANKSQAAIFLALAQDHSTAHGIPIDQVLDQWVLTANSQQ